MLTREIGISITKNLRCGIVSSVQNFSCGGVNDHGPCLLQLYGALYRAFIGWRTLVSHGTTPATPLRWLISSKITVAYMCARASARACVMCVRQYV